MRILSNTKFLCLLSLWSMAGVSAVWAADSGGDGQQQARSLLGGRHSSAFVGVARSAVEPLVGSAASNVDAQEQGRQMILGRPSSRATGVIAAPGIRTAGKGGDNMARRMILRSAS